MRTPTDRPVRFYKARFKSGGPLVPIKFTITQDIDPETGELADDEVFAAASPEGPVNPTWVEETCHEIPEDQYWALLAARATVPEMLATHVRLDLRHTIITP